MTKKIGKYFKIIEDEESQKILSEIVREINITDLNSFKLTEQISFGDLINSTTFQLVSKENLDPFFDFHLEYDIQIDEKNYTVILVKKQPKEHFEDEEIKNLMSGIDLICGKDELNLQTFPAFAINEEDVDMRESLWRPSRVGAEITYMNNDDNISDQGRSKGTSIFNNGMDDAFTNEEKKNDNILRTPIEFMYYMDDIYDFNNNKEMQSKEEQKNTKENNKDKFTLRVIEEEVKKFDFEGNMKKSRKTINVFKIIENDKICFIADSMGNITKYKYDNFTHVYTYDDCKNFKKAKIIEALCIDYFDGVLVGGFSSGGIIVWENDNNTKFYIEDIFLSPILCVKILEIQNSKREIIASDSKGNCHIIYKTKKFFSDIYKIQEPILFKGLNVSIKQIDVLTKDNEPINPNEFSYENAKFVFGYENKKLLTIMTLKPKNTLFEINESNDNEILYAFGKGYLPSNRESEDNLNLILYTTENAKICDIFILYEGEKIELFYYRSDKSKYESYASYEFNENLLQIGFFPNSFIFLIQEKNIKLLSTFEFKINHVDDKNRSNKIIFKDRNIKELNLNNMFRTEKFEKIFVVNNKLAIITDSIHYFKLITWKQYLDSLKENCEWDKVLRLGKELLNKKSSAMLLGETTDEAEYFNNQKDQQIESLLNAFMNAIINGKDQSKTEESIQEIIEFCIHMNSLNFIANEFHNALKPQIKSKKDNQNSYSDILENHAQCYFNCLEKMILQGKFASISNIPETFIINIIQHYLHSKKKMMLTKLLLNFNYTSLAGKKVTEILQKNYLIKEIIYVVMKDKNQDYFSPVDMIFNLFLNQPESVNYESFITLHEHASFTDDMLSSKQYLGHRLLWYCDYVLNGKKYPEKREIINATIYNSVCIKIFLFLAKKIKVLIQFDSFSYFEILKRFFAEDDLFKLINVQYNNKTLETFMLKYKVKGKTCNEIVNKIIEKSRNMENFYILKDLYTFLGEVCARGRSFFSIDKKIILNGINFLFQYPIEEATLPDQFCCHPRSGEVYPQLIASIERSIMTFFKFIENELTNEEIRELSIKFSISSFDIAEIFLYDLLKEYNASLNLQINSIIKQNPIDNQKKDKFFKWIEQKLNDFKEKNDTSSYNFFINLLLEHFYDLTCISLKDACKIIDNYCSRRHKKIAINQLNNYPSLQLQYVENILENYDHSDDEEDDNNSPFLYDDSLSECSLVSTSSVSSITYSSYEDFSALKIKLLCQLNEKEKMVEYVKSNVNICNKKVLSILKENKIYDGAIYVYQYLGDFKPALELTIKEIDLNYRNIIDNLKSHKFKERKNIILLQNHKKYLDLGIKTCQLLSEEAYQEDSWLYLLNKLYSLKDEFKTIVRKNQNNEKTYFYNKVEEEISSAIERILGKMCENVRVPLMVETVSEKCKDAGLKEFRKVLMEVFHKLTLMEIILELVVGIIGKEISKISRKLKFDIKEGSIMSSKCSMCKKNFIDKDNTVMFFCGHVFHDKCCYFFLEKEIKTNVCYVCWKKDKITFINKKIPVIGIEKEKKGKEDKGNEEKRKKEEEIREKEEKRKFEEERKEQEKKEKEKAKEEKKIKLKKRKKYYDELYRYKENSL